MPIYMKRDTFLNEYQFAMTISGLSNHGAHQFLGGQIVTNASDRLALASAVLRQWWFSGITDGTSIPDGTSNTSIALLRPAEKNALIGLLRPVVNDVSIGLLRQAAQKIRNMIAESKSPLNLTEIGLLRFLSGDFVSSPQDRSALALVVTRVLASPKGI